MMREMGSGHVCHERARQIVTPLLPKSTKNLDFKFNGNPSGLKLRGNVDDNSEKDLNIDKIKCDIKQNINETITPKIGSEIERRRKGAKYEVMTIEDKIKNIQREINRNKPFTRTTESLKRLTKIRLLLEDIKVLLKMETEKYKYKDEFKEYVPFSDDISHADFIAQKKAQIMKDGLALIPGL
ncbi:unnamed protein product, partial [Brenthis ino]